MMKLRFERVPDGTTVLRERHVAYPYTVLAPLRDTRVIVQSASGGLFGGERLRQEVTAGPAAVATVEFPAATVVHEMRDDAMAEQAIGLRAEAGGRLVYLARPVILFPDSRLRQRVGITLGEGAGVIVSDGFLTHDATGMARPFGWYENELTLRDERGTTLAIDRTRVDGASVAAGIPGVGGEFRAFGTVLAAGSCAPAVVEAVQADLDAHPDLFAGVTPLRREAGLLVRIAAADGGHLHAALGRLVRLMARG